jgi:hypothetical protein
MRELLGNSHRAFITPTVFILTFDKTYLVGISQGIAA